MDQHWIAHSLGRLETTISVGLQEVHRRIDDRHREVMFHVRRLDKRKNGNGGKPMWMHMATLGALYGLMLLSLFKPEAAGALIGIVLRQLLH